MNIENNKRKKYSQEQIEKAFVSLLQNREIGQITVTDICKITKLNRTTFYNNYLDIYDLADKIRLKLVKDINLLYEQEHKQKYNSNDFLKLLQLMQENQLFFKAYFKLENNPNLFFAEIKHPYDTDLSKEYFNDQYIDYHITFFKAGFNAIVKKWLSNGCLETPEEIEDIIKSEYNRKKEI